MLLFRSEEEVRAWCAGRARAQGAILGLSELMALARGWYGDRLDPGWRPRTLEASQRVLARAGLAGDFWRLG
jgi:hypothetical protein